MVLPDIIITKELGWVELENTISLMACVDNFSSMGKELIKVQY